MLEKLIRLRDGGAVTRFHTERFAGPKQNVAEHSFGVALLLLQLNSSQYPPSSHLLAAALCHDLAEQETGDLPAPAKWAVYGEDLEALESHIQKRLGVHYTLSGEEKAQLRAADFLDALLTCLEQMMLGNQYIHIVVDRLRRHQNERHVLDFWEPARKLYQEICGAYDAAYSRQNPILQTLTDTDPWKHHPPVAISGVSKAVPRQSSLRSPAD